MSKELFNAYSWLYANTEDYVDEYLSCTDQSRDDFKDESDLQEAVQSWLNDNTELDWEDFKEQCEEEENHHVLVTGYFMSWMGPQTGGKIFKNLLDAVTGSIMDGDSCPIFSLTDEGMLVLNETHHDAPTSGNHYEFRVLTDRGETYLNNHIDDDRRTLHEALKEKGRTRNVNIKIFGFNTKEELK